MHLFDLQSLLRRLNPDLQVLTDRPVYTIRDNPSYPLVLRFGRRDNFGVGKKLMDSTTQKYIAMKESGELQYICGVNRETPEYDILDPKTGVMVIQGWRTLAKILLAKRVTSRDLISRYLSSSIGQTKYDSMSFQEKLSIVRDGQDA